MFYTDEVNGAGIRNPIVTGASTLTAAKGVASRRQVFQGTTLVVYDQHGCRVAVKNTNWREGWRDVQEPQPTGAREEELRRDFYPEGHPSGG